MPLRIESAPNVGSTWLEASSFKGARKGFSSTLANSNADFWSKLPEICPRPVSIGPRITGAEDNSRPSTMANWRPTFSRVIWANFSAPSEFKVKSISGSPMLLRVTMALLMLLPSISARFFTNASVHPLLAVAHLSLCAAATRNLVR